MTSKPKPFRGLLVRTDGTVEIVELRNDNPQEVAKHIGEDVDMEFSSVGNIVVLCDENGIRKMLPPNSIAMEIVAQHIGHRRPYYGNVIITGATKRADLTDVLDAGLTIDSMDPEEWIEAQEMD